MSGKVGKHFYCVYCDVKLNHEADYQSHCNGKKHKNNERIKTEQESAAASVVVRGAKGCKDLEQFLASYFVKFGLLARISPLGPVSHGICKVQFVQPESVARVLDAGPVHRHYGVALRVSKFEYKPYGGDARRLAAKEEAESQKNARDDLHTRVLEIIGKEDSVQNQLEALTDCLKLTVPDLLERAEIVCKLREVFAPSYPEVAVYQFGSSINGFGMRRCDLDLFLNLELDNPVSNKQVKSLVKVLSARALAHIFTEVMFVPSMRCPIIKFTHKPSGTKCDLSLNNKKALYNTRLLRLYATDPRVQHLVFALRSWAKFRGLSGGAGASTPSLLSSYALSLLVLFYLMRCHPEPVLPAVCDLEKYVPGIAVETVEESQCLNIPEDAQLPPSRNSQSSVELLQGFFQFYNKEVDWTRDALLMKEARLAERASLSTDFKYLQCKIGAMTVIDPFNLSHNVAGNVNDNFCKRFVDEIKRATDLSSSWTESNASGVDGDEHPVSSRLQELFELADLTEQKNSGQDDKGTEENAGKNEPKKGKKSKTNNKTPLRTEGEQENGEFHIILPVSSATLGSEDLKEEARQSGSLVEQCWLDRARNFTLNVLDTVFLAECEERKCEEIGDEVEEKSREREFTDQVNTDCGERSKKSQGKDVEQEDTSVVSMDVEEDLQDGSSVVGKKRSSNDVLEAEATSCGQSPKLSQEEEGEVSRLGLENEMPNKRLCLPVTPSTSTAMITPTLVAVTTAKSTALSCLTTTITSSSATSGQPISSSTTQSKPEVVLSCDTAAPTRSQIGAAVDTDQLWSCQTSLWCKCGHPVWQGRKKMKHVLEQTQPAVTSRVGITLEREITQRCLTLQTGADHSQNPPAKHISVKTTTPSTQPKSVIEGSDITQIVATAALLKSLAEHVGVEAKNLSTLVDRSTIASQRAMGDSTNLPAQDAIMRQNNVASVEKNTDVIQKSPAATQHSNKDLVGQGKSIQNSVDGSKVVTANVADEDEHYSHARTSSDSSKQTGLVSVEASGKHPEKTDASEVKPATVQSDPMNNALVQKPASSHSTPQNSNRPEKTSAPSGLNNNKHNYCLEFSCDLQLNCGRSGLAEAQDEPSQPPHLLIRLRPAKDSVKQFKMFYDVFRSVMLRLNATDLNVKV